MKENIILETFLRLTNRTYPYGTEHELINSMTGCGIFPKDIKTDEYGNYFLNIGESRTIFASHLDTVSKDSMSVVHVFDGNMIKTDGRTILGADDKAGVTILLHLIGNKIPGLYYFFVGEEVGCVGSGLAAKNLDFKGKYDRIVSFDRRDTGSVITYQSYSRCCSDIFAESLCGELNKQGMKYKKDTGGVYTDSAEFTSIIPECTNISVGYYREHTTSESQNIKHLEELAKACIKINWELLPVSRDPSKYDCNSLYWDDKPNRQTRHYSSKDYYQDDWYDQGSRNGDSRTHRRSRPLSKTPYKKDKNIGKAYYDNDKVSVQIKTPESKSRVFGRNGFDKNNYYDSLVDKILDSNLNKEELEIVKDQYLDMNNDNDNQFYEYLLSNVID